MLEAEQRNLWDAKPETKAELQKLSPREQKLERTKRVVEAAQGIPVLFSGGSEIGDEDLMENAEICVEAGSIGFIYGRNMWKRPEAPALQITEELKKLLDQKAHSLF